MGERTIGESIRLCNWIAGHGAGAPQVATIGRERVVEIGERALGEHGDRIGVLLAVARMFKVARETGRAINVLVRAARIAPSEPLTFRLLGEILLGCGDAVRAERMLDRAVSEGMTDPETLSLRARARSSAFGKPPIPPGQTLPPPALAPVATALPRIAAQRASRPPADSYSNI